MSIHQSNPNNCKFKVAAFYSFTSLKEEVISMLLAELVINADLNKVFGTVLLASEGINGTICGSIKGVNSLIEYINSVCLGNSLEVKVSWTDQQAFRRFKVRQKNEIVTMGVEGVDPLETVGNYVEPSEWNKYLLDPDTLVIDTRNNYEIGIGSFKGALDPQTNCFREFPYWVKSFLRPLVKEKAPKRIAMFCTGGIRCEKATSYLNREGFEGVHHLHGGILRYLEEIPQKDSLWEGECFVFDDRVALNHNLVPGEHCLCYACGMPLNNEDRQNTSYVRGVQCHHCKDIFDDCDRARFAERQRQYDQKLVSPSIKTLRKNS